MLKFVSILLVCVFVFLSIANAFWYEKTPEKASEYIYNIDIQVIQNAFDRYESYVRVSVDNVSATYEETKNFLDDLGDDMYDRFILSLADFDFSALVDLDDGDVSAEDIVTVFREYFLFSLRFGRNILSSIGSFAKFVVLSFKLLWYVVQTVSVGVLGIFDVLSTFVSLFKGTDSPVVPEIPTEIM